MARISIDGIRSASLQMATSLTIIAPNSRDLAPDAPAPGRVAYMLHGLSGDHSIWPTYAPVQRWADKYNALFVFPSGERSFWTNAKYGLAWADWAFDEAPEYVETTLGVASPKRRIVAGFSMAGYGALKAALARPNFFRAAISLSGTTDIAEGAFKSRHQDLYQNVFGLANARGSAFDLFTQLENADPAALPRLWACCGRDDRLLDMNRRFAALAKKLGVSYEYTEGSGGHDYAYWNPQMAAALESVAQLW